VYDAGRMKRARAIKSEVVVIGGGATGCGVARDLALRGIEVLLLEQHDVAHGATGRCHGLLHSGVRYAVKDPVAAAECIKENKILCHIAPECIEPTGGMVIRLPGDDPNYRLALLDGCKQAGIETEEIGGEEARDMEPWIHPDTESAILVPDASVDPFLLALENLRDAQRNGAGYFLHTKVTGFEIEKGRLRKVLAENDDGPLEIECAVAVIAAGGWGQGIGKAAGVKLGLELSKGSLMILNRRFTNRVINRCRPPSDADLIIPNGPTSIIGTTSISVKSPEGLQITEPEVKVLLSEGGAMVPDFHGARALRAYAGVRPLYVPPSSQGSGRELSRGFVVVDHEQLDGVKGLVSIVGGKLTTYRLMAEKTADHVAKMLGVTKSCVTADRGLFEGESCPFYSRSERLSRISGSNPQDMICECELVSRDDLLQILPELAGRADLADLQHRTRLGMGPCQGGFCSLRALGLMAEQGMFADAEALPVLERFLNRRWKGILPVLWGDQWREEQLNYGMYATLFNLDRERS
jgi:glycerol-3-phosphate dehydrogenase